MIGLIAWLTGRTSRRTLRARLADAEARLAVQAGRLAGVRDLADRLRAERDTAQAEADKLRAELAGDDGHPNGAAHWRRRYQQQVAANAALDDRLAAAEGRPVQTPRRIP